MYINGWKQIFGDGWIKRCPPPHPFQGFKTDETGGREGFRLSSSRFEKSNGKSVLSGKTIRQSTFLIVFDNEQCPCVHTMETRDVYVCVCVCVCVQDREQWPFPLNKWMKLLSSGFEVWAGHARETNRLIAFILPSSSSSLKQAKEANLVLVYYDHLLRERTIEFIIFEVIGERLKELIRILEKRERGKKRAFSQRVVEKLLISLRAREKKLRMKKEQKYHG